MLLLFQDLSRPLWLLLLTSCSLRVSPGPEAPSRSALLVRRECALNYSHPQRGEQEEERVAAPGPARPGSDTAGPVRFEPIQAAECKQSGRVCVSQRNVGEYLRRKTAESRQGNVSEQLLVYSCSKKHLSVAFRP